jgi:cysteine dioxygenase
MVLPSLPEKLGGQFDSLLCLSNPLSVDELCTLLHTLSAHRDELEQFSRFDEKCYRRNRIFRNDALDVLLLCWRPSQRTPIHDHTGSTCGVYVVQGEATEIGFNPSGVGLLVPTGSKQLRAGDITVSVDSDAHLVGNFAAPAQDLITLHCYSPPLSSMRVFDQHETFFANYGPITESATSTGCYHHEI